MLPIVCTKIRIRLSSEISINRRLVRLALLLGNGLHGIVIVMQRSIEIHTLRKLAYFVYNNNR